MDCAELLIKMQDLASSQDSNEEKLIQFKEDLLQLGEANKIDENLIISALIYLNNKLLADIIKMKKTQEEMNSQYSSQIKKLQSQLIEQSKKLEEQRLTHEQDNKGVMNLIAELQRKTNRLSSSTNDLNSSINSLQNSLNNQITKMTQTNRTSTNQLNQRISQLEGRIDTIRSTNSTESTKLDKLYNYTTSNFKTLISRMHTAEKRSARVRFNPEGSYYSDFGLRSDP